jgi:hypothetical protein
MDDTYGLKAAAARGITLGPVGTRLLMENDFIRLWEVKLEPGETIDFHIHHHPYLVISLGGGENEIELITGEKRTTDEPIGFYVFINDMRPVHRLTNRSDLTYFSRLIEMKSVAWTT